MEPREKVYEILKSFSAAMLVTIGPGKQPECRPMQIARVDDGGDIWFFTGKSGRIVDEIAMDSAVLLALQNEHSVYLSLRGRARAVPDHARKKELWKEAYKVWFPGGVEDPELALIAVDPMGAEYWDNRGMNKVEYMFESAKAYLKGEKPAVSDVDQHAKTAM